MDAARARESGCVGGRQLALWVPPDEAGEQGKEGFAHRSNNPVRGLAGGGEPAWDWAAEVAGEAEAVEIPEG
jgi:hypothetical protein